jgi:cytochrome c-type biogenesis protein
VANILLFTAFTLGICAPLIAFSLVTPAASRWMINALVTYERQISVIAGLTMVGVALYYLIVVFAVFD